MIWSCRCLGGARCCPPGQPRAAGARANTPRLARPARLVLAVAVSQWGCRKGVLGALAGLVLSLLTGGAGVLFEPRFGAVLACTSRTKRGHTSSPSPALSWNDGGARRPGCERLRRGSGPDLCFVSALHRGMRDFVRKASTRRRSSSPRDPRAPKPRPPLHARREGLRGAGARPQGAAPPLCRRRRSAAAARRSPAPLSPPLLPAPAAACPPM